MLKVGDEVYIKENSFWSDRKDDHSELYIDVLHKVRKIYNGSCYLLEDSAYIWFSDDIDFQRMRSEKLNKMLNGK